jgi:hypothetical protein
MWTATGRLETKLDRLLVGRQRDWAKQRLATHLRHERPYLFTFLYRGIRPSKPNDSGLASSFNARSSTPLIRIRCLRSYLPGFTLPSV